jgi:hypothetical protein
MENNVLIKYEGGLIKRVGNAISVTNKLLATTEPQLIPYRKKDKWGFCTADKKIVIDCEYDVGSEFSEGLAIVTKNNKYGFVNKKGHLVIPLIYSYLNGFSENFSAAVKEEGYGFIDINEN